MRPEDQDTIRAALPAGAELHVIDNEYHYAEDVLVTGPQPETTKALADAELLPEPHDGLIPAGGRDGNSLKLEPGSHFPTVKPAGAIIMKAVVPPPDNDSRMAW